MFYAVIRKRLQSIASRADLKALVLVRQKLQKLKDGDDHVGDRLHLMLVHSRLLIVHLVF